MEKVESHHDIQGKADGPNQGFDMVVDGLVTVADQVWSLTQYYSVNFSQSRIGVKSAASVVVDGVLGPRRIALHTLRCPCISAVPEATHEAS